MATEMINIKLDSKFLKDIDKIVKTKNYQNRTEFIREALRDKVAMSEEQKIFLEKLEKIRGSAKKKTTEEEYERVRQQVFNNL